MSSSSRGARLLGRLALLAAGLLAAEVGLRVVLALRGEAPAAEVARLLERVEGWREPVAEGRPQEGQQPSLPDPFLGFTTERMGWRLANQAATFTGDDYEILLLGGSLAAGLATMAAEDLQATVGADPRFAGRAVRVVNMARGAYKQPQQLNLLSAALSHGWLPDAVIELDGFNELAISVQNALEHGVHPSRPAFFMWGPLVRPFTSDPELRALALALESERQRARSLAGARPLGLQHSALVSTLDAARMRGTVRRFEQARDAYLARIQAGVQDPALTGPPFEPDFEAVLDLAVRDWTECSRSMHALCAARGIAYLHVLQPTLHDEGSKPLTPEEREAGALGPAIWARAARAGYPRLRAEGERLRSLGVPFHDASRVFADDERSLYYDICHFGGPGQFTLAIDIGRAFLEQLP